METYDEIYGRMKNAYEHETGDSFNEVSDIAIRLKVLAGEIFKLQTNLEWWKRQMFAVSASGECLDKLASQRGIERKKVNFFLNRKFGFNKNTIITTLVY